MAKKNVCQSCGMPLEHDPKGGGTNKDGSISDIYCSYCFGDGDFLQPNITFTEMKALVKDKVKDMGVPGFLTGFFTMNLHKLDRWKNRDYSLQIS